MDDPDDLLDHWQSKYNLTEAHIDYLRKDVEEAFDIPTKHRRDETLGEIENEIMSTGYMLVSKVGSGAFGNVYKGIRTTDKRIVAIKVIDLEETKDDIGSINQEIMALVNGKTCQQLTNYYDSKVLGTKLWIVMEYVDGGSVLDKVNKQGGRLEEKQISIIVREVLLGLKYLALEGKFHRDIKAANVLISATGQVKLADFGATRQLTDTVTKCDTFVGSPYWMAPEVLMSDKYDSKADVWSLGITCLEMATGRPPNAHVHPMQVIRLIPSQPPPSLDNSDGQWSKAFLEFVDACLTKDPEMRPSIHELLKFTFVERAGKTKMLGTQDQDDEDGDCV